jgi:nucleotide-binding universal stress UspA family protein
MYSIIAVPVDLEHIDRLEKALRTAVDLARHYGATLCYIGATTETPSPIAHNPAEYKRKLEAFAEAEAKQHGIAAKAKAVVCLDMTIDLDKHLMEAFDEVDADLVVMASHIPGIKEHLFSSNAGYIASHAEISVFIIR